MTLSEQQIERYKAHIMLKGVGGHGQQKLLRARVLVVGAGGLGSSCLLYLAAAGVGTIGIVDEDKVALSNLQRQILFQEKHIGRSKVECAVEMLHALNSDINLEPHNTNCDANNALSLLERYDLIVDGTDTFSSRLLLSDACYLGKKTLISAAVGLGTGQLSTFSPHLKRPNGEPYPSYRCWVGSEIGEISQEPCAQQGILGSLTGVMGSLQAQEVIKKILGKDGTLDGRLLLYDSFCYEFRLFIIPWDCENPLNGHHASIKDLSEHVEFDKV